MITTASARENQLRATLLAAVTMSLSSLSVIANALRRRRFKP